MKKINHYFFIGVVCVLFTLFLVGSVKAAPTGALTVSSCQIPVGPYGRCAITVSWTTSGATSPYVNTGSSVYASETGSTLAGNLTTSPSIIWVTHQAVSISLYGNGIPLDTENIYMNCVSGSQFIGDRCLSQPSCTLPWGGSVANGQTIKVFPSQYAIANMSPSFPNYNCNHSTAYRMCICSNGAWSNTNNGGQCLGNFSVDYDALAMYTGGGPTCSSVNAFLVGTPNSRPDTATNSQSETYATIPVNGSSCSVPLSWTTTNVSSPAVVELSDNQFGNNPIASGFSGSKNVTMPYNSNGFYYLTIRMPHDTSKKDMDRIYLGCSCVSGTIWDGTRCYIPPMCTSFSYSAWGACNAGIQTMTITGALPAGCSGGIPLALTRSCPTATLNANPTSIVSGSSTVLSWSTTNSPTNCTAISGNGSWTGVKVLSGSDTINPITTSTYTLTCTKSGYPNAVSTANVAVTCVPSYNNYSCSFVDVDSCNSSNVGQLITIKTAYCNAQDANNCGKFLSKGECIAAGTPCADVTTTCPAITGGSDWHEVAPVL